MEKYIVKGGKPLMGEVSISGAKNSAVALLPATVLANDVCVLENVPDISDIRKEIEILKEMGAKVKRISPSILEIDTSTLDTTTVPMELGVKFRASYYFLGSLLSRYGKASVPMPGGCDLGARPIDQHLKAFMAFGAEYDLDYAMINVATDNLEGAHVFFDTISVGATINAMLAASMAKGTTILENVAKEPHIVDVANFLNTMGADIRGAGTDVIKIRGVEKMHGATYTVVPDQIEAGTFMVAAAITKGNVLIKNVIPKHLDSISAKLMEIGVTVEEYDDSVRVIGTDRVTRANVKTMPHPGFPTDMQPQMVTLLALGDGTSIVTENVWDNRFKYIDELTKMGANIRVDGRTAVIEGVEKLSGAPVSSTDLRAGAAMVLAGLAAQGVTEVYNLKYIDRGYEKFEEKLRNLGAQIARRSTDDTTPARKSKTA